MYVLLVLGVLLGVLILLEGKTSRSDGTLIDVHPYRRIMWFIMRTRNESVVYWDFQFDAEPLLDYLALAEPRFGAKPSHAFVAAVAVALDTNKDMNRFVSGKRMYQRKGRWVSFSMKRKRLNKEAKLAVVKQRVDEAMTFQDLCEKINGQITEQRSGEKTYSDHEIRYLNYMPRPLFSLVFRLTQMADYYNLLPAGFVAGDPMYCSVFISNLGSMAMDPGYHHLYEWGNCPIFLMVGQVVDVPTRGENDELVWKKRIPIRVSYDERVNDGLSAYRGVQVIKRVLENPAEAFGCLDPDGSDARPLVRPDGDVGAG